MAIQEGLPGGSTAEQEAYHHILAAIRAGRFGPGDRLIPESLAGEIGMSRMPVREAIQRLASEGLVTIRPNRGCTVSGLTIEDIAEIFEIRSVLEGLAVRLATPCLDRAARAELDALLRPMRASERAGDEAWAAHHSRLHEYLAALSRRPKLVRQIRTLMITVEPYMRIYRHHVCKVRSADEAHRLLVETIKRGDPEASEAAMREHVLGTVPLLRSFVGETRLSRPTTVPSTRRQRIAS